MKNNFKMDIDARLQDLDWHGEENVLQKIHQTPHKMQHRSFYKRVPVLVSALILLMCSVAFAVTLKVSPRYIAARLANREMLLSYGVTEKMMTILHREIVENDDGSFTVFYEALEPDVRNGDNRIGVYTVYVHGKKATSTWSLMGVETTGGLDAPAWGAMQLALYSEDYAGTRRYMKENNMLAASFPDLSIPYDEYIAQQQKARATVEEKQTISLDEAKQLARDALIAEYALTKAQADQLIIYSGEDDQTVYKYENDKALISLYFHLAQGEAWIEKDGIYVVTVDVENAVVENIYYDSGLAGHG